jgi:predicted NAD-dependent protein-ADP-ribosyltransferase YbiA (DUF1768 family)
MNEVNYSCEDDLTDDEEMYELDYPGPEEIFEDEELEDYEEDELFYFSKSPNKPAGKGEYERVQNYDDYAELNKINNWRRLLSNYDCNEFIYENKVYNTVEHAFQAKKIELVDTDKAFLFTKNSFHPIGMGEGLFARKNRKIAILSPEQVMYWDDIKQDIMEDILLAKFTQIPIAKQALLLTRDAALLHGTKYIPVCRQCDLEKIRDMLKNN